MKSYTDLKQSKKLVGILPLESSDMIYIPMMDIDSMSNSGFFNIPECYPFNEFKDSDTKPLPCWSLAALLEELNRNCWKVSLKCCGAEWDMTYDDGEIYISVPSDYAIDACYGLIIKLHEQKLL